MPFNVESVNFSKLLDTKSVESFQKGKSLPASSLEESFGLIRALTIVEAILPTAKLELFKKRFNEGYDLSVDTDDGCLWKIYNGIRKALSEEESKPKRDQDTDNNAITTSKAPHSSEVSNETAIEITIKESIEFFEDDEQSAAATPEPSLSSMIRLATFTEHQSPAKNSESHMNESLIEVAHSTPNKVAHVRNDDKSSTSSTVEEASTSYSNYEKSPFKRFLKISDKTFIARKAKAPKPVAPSAITGKMYNETMKLTQKKKAEAIAEKNRRKEEREKKKALKQTQGKHKRVRKESSSESESDVRYADDSRDEAVQLEEESGASCRACAGNDRWEESTAWIGCNTCDAWIHRECVSDEVENMTEEQIEHLNFVCHACQKRESRTKPKK